MHGKDSTGCIRVAGLDNSLSDVMHSNVQPSKRKSAGGVDAELANELTIWRHLKITMQNAMKTANIRGEMMVIAML